MNEQNKVGETKRQALERKVGELCKVIKEQTSGIKETQEQTMAVGVTKVGKCVDARKLSAVAQTGKENRPPNLGTLPGQLPSESSWKVPGSGEQRYSCRTKEIINVM